MSIPAELKVELAELAKFKILQVTHQPTFEEVSTAVLVTIKKVIKNPKEDLKEGPLGPPRPPRPPRIGSPRGPPEVPPRSPSQSPDWLTG